MMIIDSEFNHDVSLGVDDFRERQRRNVTPYFEGTRDGTSNSSYAQIRSIIFYSGNKH